MVIEGISLSCEILIILLFPWTPEEIKYFLDYNTPFVWTRSFLTDTGVFRTKLM